MKKWQHYSKYLDTGDWHSHTKYTDGRNTVMEMCRQAEKNGLKLIAFTEHVRRSLSYNFDSLLKDASNARKKFPELKILVGCEAKVLDPEGSLDVSDEILKKCDIVLGTFHSFPASEKKDLENALRNMLRNPALDIWTHPITLFQKCPLCEKDACEMIKLCIKNNVLVENNIRPRYRFPKLIEACRRMDVKMVTGSDAHGVEDLRILNQD
ncbi:MAG: PHP domain-containing protein [Candidatus Aenigmarchaeota archaeon]|nr:PHP domain-containing protein [Candidatus Aenigmarchaeota archaeon]